MITGLFFSRSQMLNSPSAGTTSGDLVSLRSQPLLPRLSLQGYQNLCTPTSPQAIAGFVRIFTLNAGREFRAVDTWICWKGGKHRGEEDCSPPLQLLVAEALR